MFFVGHEQLMVRSLLGLSWGIPSGHLGYKACVRPAMLQLAGHSAWDGERGLRPSVWPALQAQIWHVSFIYDGLGEDIYEGGCFWFAFEFKALKRVISGAGVFVNYEEIRLEWTFTCTLFPWRSLQVAADFYTENWQNNMPRFQLHAGWWVDAVEQYTRNGTGEVCLPLPRI